MLCRQGLVSCLGHCSPRETTTGTYWMGSLVGPRAGLDGCEKSRPPPVFDSRTAQPVASRYIYRLHQTGPRTNMDTTFILTKGRGLTVDENGYDICHPETYGINCGRKQTSLSLPTTRQRDGPSACTDGVQRIPLNVTPRVLHQTA